MVFSRARKNAQSPATPGTLSARSASPSPSPLTPKRRFALPWSKRRTPPPPVPTPTPTAPTEPQPMPPKSIVISEPRKVHSDAKTTQAPPSRPHRGPQSGSVESVEHVPPPPAIPKQYQRKAPPVKNSGSSSTVSTNATTLSSAFEWDSPPDNRSLFSNQTSPQTSPPGGKYGRGTTPTSTASQKAKRHHQASDSVTTDKSTSTTSTGSSVRSQSGGSARAHRKKQSVTLRNEPPPPLPPSIFVNGEVVGPRSSPSKDAVHTRSQSSPTSPMSERSPSSVFDSPLARRIRNVKVGDAGKAIRNVVEMSPNSRARSALKSMFDSPTRPRSWSSSPSKNQEQQAHELMEATESSIHCASRGVRVGDATRALRNMVNEDTSTRHPMTFSTDQSPPFDYSFEIAASNNAAYQTPSKAGHSKKQNQKKKSSPPKSSEQESTPADSVSIGSNFLAYPPPESASKMKISPSLAKLRIPSIHVDGLSMEDVFTELEDRMGVRLDDENVDLSQGKFEEAVKAVHRRSLHRKSLKNLHKKAEGGRESFQEPEAVPQKKPSFEFEIRSPSGLTGETVTAENGRDDSQKSQPAASIPDLFEAPPTPPPTLPKPNNAKQRKSKRSSKQKSLSLTAEGPPTPKLPTVFVLPPTPDASLQSISGIENSSPLAEQGARVNAEPTGRKRSSSVGRRSSRSRKSRDSVDLTKRNSELRSAQSLSKTKPTSIASAKNEEEFEDTPPLSPVTTNYSEDSRDGTPTPTSKADKANKSDPNTPNMNSHEFQSSLYNMYEDSPALSDFSEGDDPLERMMDKLEHANSVSWATENGDFDGQFDDAEQSPPRVL